MQELKASSPSIIQLRKVSGNGGFALIATLVLMSLLVMLLVGLLSLSAVSLRTSSQDSTQIEAQANARLGLMMALGELQKHAGPDVAVTVPSDIVDAAPAKSHLTGVWKSWDFDPSAGSPDYDSEKSDRFQQWLVSSPDPIATRNMDFVNSGWGGETIELVGEGSLGVGAPDEAKVSAGRVLVSSEGKANGAFAWHVSDEAAKAHINVPRNPDMNDTLAQKAALLGGQRPYASRIMGLDGSLLDFLPGDGNTAAFNLSKANKMKLISLNQFDLLPAVGNGASRIKPFRHDVTPYSLGLLTDVRHGGLKQDLTSAFERVSFSNTTNLPVELAGKGLYETTHGITGVSDPRWGALASYYNTYKVLNNTNSNPKFSQPPSEQLTLSDTESPGKFFPGPVIQKVEMMLSIVVRDNHLSPTDRYCPSATYPFLGHLVFTPIVTLHNPYNVNISFDQMKVTMDNVPVAFLIYLNGDPINTRLLDLSYYFFQNHKSGVGATSFTIRIADWTNWDKREYTKTNGPIVMKPGQSLVCSPYLDPSYTWRNITAQNQTDDFRYENRGRKSKPGYYGRCFGFDSDVIRPKFNYDGADNIQTNTPPQPPKSAFLGLRTEDFDNGNLRLECAIRQPITGTTRSGIDDTQFQVRAEVTVAGTDYNYGGLRFGLGADDNEPTTDVFTDGIAPEVFDTGNFRVNEAYVPNAEPISNHENAQTFCVFSAYARTTSGGVYDNGTRSGTPGSALRDGRVAGMPYLFQNPARTLAFLDLATEKPGAHSHELNVQPFNGPGEVEDYFNLDPLNRTASLTGNTTQRGIKTGSYLEVPLGPMQAIADFRRSNALSSPYLPNYVQPVANSRIAPNISTDTVKMPADGASGYELLDHGFLANHALYDQFYFSTFAGDGALDAEDVFEGFMNSGESLLSQAYQPYVPSGQSVASAQSELFASGTPTADAYQRAAAYQMVRGSFNVNSTRVEAWKAMLAAASKEKVVTLWAKNTELEEHTPTGVPVMPMGLVNGGVVGGDAEFEKIDNQATNDWNGYRELSEIELESLATNIVDQVRERGPFLSMSEFVNRRIGPDSELSRMGALEAAIENAGINRADFLDQVPVTEGDLGNAKLYGFRTPLASVGNPAAGAPGWISQGDLLRLLEPAATVRSDTFVIRVCGQALDTSGNIAATAYAEAVVQRLPEHVDNVDNVFVNAHSDPTASSVNQRFGRRFAIVSFRWLNPSEI